MAKRYQIATIQVLMNAEDSAQASDGLNELFREAQEYDFIQDWGFLQIGGQIIGPSEKFLAEPYEEGDMFNP